MELPWAVARGVGAAAGVVVGEARGDIRGAVDVVVCENSADGLRGFAVVELEHAAEPLTAP